MSLETQDSTEQNSGLRHLIDVQDSRQSAAQQGQAEWLTHLQSGDRAAAEKLVDQYYQRIYLYMRQLGHNRQASEDLTQEVFMKAWYHLGQLRNGSTLSGWLFRIAHNVSCQHWRRRGRREAAVGEGIELRVEDNRGQEIREDRVAYTEQLERLQLAVEGLSLKLRQTIVLHYLQGFPISAAARVAGIREGTFKSRLNQALEALRRKTDTYQGS